MEIVSRLVQERSSRPLSKVRLHTACDTIIGEKVDVQIFQAESDGDPYQDQYPLGECTGFDNSVAFATDEVQSFDCVLRGGQQLISDFPCERNNDSLCGKHTLFIRLSPPSCCLLETPSR